MSKKKKSVIAWLLPIFLILFIGEIVTFTFAISITLADRSKAPDHYLTYKKGSLTWDKVGHIDQNGVAEVSVFEAEYQNVNSEDGHAVVAPGTEGENVIRLRNATTDTISFTAIMYEVRTSDTLPVKVSLGENSKKYETADAGEYTLPKFIPQDKVLRAVKGEVGGQQICDFDINWLWDYYISDEKDLIDIDFGDKAAFDRADELTVGFHIVVEADGVSYPAKTGDSSVVRDYAIFLLITGAILVFLAATRNREKKINNEAK